LVGGYLRSAFFMSDGVGDTSWGLCQRFGWHVRELELIWATEVSTARTAALFIFISAIFPFFRGRAYASMVYAKTE